MLFESLRLQNFRAYSGCHSIDLRPPERSRPIVLFTGLNGAGKTTLLEALYLVLYGKRTPSPRRGGKSYETYLQDCMHRSKNVSESSVHLRFSQNLEGELITYDIRRTWARGSKGVREVLSVKANKRTDPVLTTEWGQHVEELLPSRLAPLFFFDGEKIEALADLRATSEVLSVAIHSLLGLDLVDRLDGDLDVLERRQISTLADSGGDYDLRQIQEQEEAAENRFRTAYEALSGLSTRLDEARKRAEAAEKTFETQGGYSFEKRTELERDLALARQEEQSSLTRLQELASGLAPLLLTPRLLEQVAQQAAVERAARESSLWGRLLEARDASFLASLTSANEGDALLTEIRSWLDRDREERGRIVGTKPYLGISEASIARLDHWLESTLPDLREDIRNRLESHNLLSRASEHAEQHLSSIPEPEQLEASRAAWQTSREVVIALEIEKLQAREVSERAEAGWKAAQEVRKRALHRYVEARQQQSDTRRVLFHSEKVRATLSVFRQRVLVRHIDRIQDLVLDGLRRLLRKERLVTDLKIDPTDFSVRLFGPDDQELSPEQFSAGERQLLATSLLWGLARASGRPMPTLIDTPLGRLDSKHRELLVERYFPCASHQVILLSTDEEISGPILDRLRPHIGHSYFLQHDDKDGSSRVVEGFPEGALVG